MIFFDSMLGKRTTTPVDFMALFSTKGKQSDVKKKVKRIVKIGIA